jgi:hypothetical protein
VGKREEKATLLGVELRGDKDERRTWTSAQGGGRWPSHCSVTLCAWARAGREMRLLGVGWLTSGPSAASYIIKDIQTSKFEI